MDYQAIFTKKGKLFSACLFLMRNTFYSVYGLSPQASLRLIFSISAFNSARLSIT